MFIGSGYTLYSIALAIYLIFLVVFIIKRLRIEYDIVFLFFCLYAYVLIKVVFLPFPLDSSAVSMIAIPRSHDPFFNIIPFQSCFKLWSYVNRIGLRFVLKQIGVQYGGNILMFIPFGFLLPILKKKITKIRHILLISAIVSFGIELIQLSVSLVIHACYRFADIDDILCNVIGALIGFLLLKCFFKVFRKVFKFDFYDLFTAKKAADKMQ